MQLEGKVAIVTGAARGIGYAIAKRFLMDGASVVLSDIDTTATLQAVKDLEQFGDVRAMAADVGDKLDIHNLMTFTVTNLGEIDILVNNAGIVHKADFLDLKEEDFDRVMRVNLKGAFLCGQAVAKRMVARVEAGGEAGTIINMSSINAIFGLPEQLAYSVSKGGLSQLTRTMAIALAKWGIRVNAIGPGSIQTDMLSAVNTDAEARKTILSRTPLGRIGEPAEIASIASFLASRDASYITGQTIYADGGRLPLSYMAEPRFKP
ncbi:MULTISPECIES: SDR family NAD(P)-dependent oxidoreductase [unclassified Ochrobactrum]|uniref:SDR family NAD(P)-dependent oxidoreductase n=1 Tax=unclassified Ochrobactrum TaxID=239106 RepID=UPI00124ED11A|nr:glucose 1-dehydrogenase [Ochrobactrum sp. Kaboul]MBA8840116.1 NAD(P)-dependent dehydrogenase (short-subunit alcohol dehydrogenase family) [Ochrobactrum sp. RH2CCR150]MDH7788706.1 glucose 1-dehydrogenase [Ochrobactrum sp. 19YEA23]URQ75134.1 MAG: glucose 1-dehydrogenase [Candidatus Ochrobactrum gambitense]WEK16071.1 MAG: glucose 1-dehydrogenase [Candidatus Ochrobactrum gambitense]